MTQLENDKLIACVDKMPAFPRSVQQVVYLTSDLNASAKEIVRVIENDPIMTLKILKAINSAFYGLPNKITSVQRAVVHLGLNTIKNLALGVAAMGMLKTQNKANFDTSLFLLHSLTTAAMSKKLAEQIGLSQTECSDSFVGGLLHDFGKVVFAEFMADEFKLALEKSKLIQSPLHEAEVEFIGINHAQVGRMLAERWGLSEQLIDLIAHHHDPAGNQSALSDCVFVANQLSKHLCFGDGGNPVVELLSDNAAERFGLSIEPTPALTMAPLIENLGDLDAIKSEAQSFIHL
ncbi:MAG: HDOD domain-containing protein [Methylococcales bacterium]|nr:HDOD domain-containing protein [Methylococcaceae bacterium]